MSEERDFLTGMPESGCARLIIDPYYQNLRKGRTDAPALVIASNNR